MATAIAISFIMSEALATVPSLGSNREAHTPGSESSDADIAYL